MQHRHAARTATLGIVAFVATMILLVGLALAVSGGALGPAASDGTAAGSESPGTTEAPPATQTAAPPTESPTPTESPPSEDDPVLVGAGDIGTCGGDNDEATARLIDAIDGTVFTAGDNVYDDGSTAQFEGCYENSWGRHRERTRPAPGNHDYRTPGAAGYLAYFGDAAVNAEGRTWYSYDLGTWHIVMLDSNCDDVGGCTLDSEQGRWLQADLAASTATCTLAIWHHPRFSSGFHGNDRDVGPFWQALYAAGADVVVNGHDHDYERFAPQDPDGEEDRQRGIRQFVVGTGGIALRPFEEIAPNSELRFAVTHGVIKLTLRPGSYEWTWLPSTGDITDSGSARCH